MNSEIQIVYHRGIAYKIKYEWCEEADRFCTYVMNSEGQYIEIPEGCEYSTLEGFKFKGGIN